MTVPTQLSLYNQALRLVGEGMLSSLTDNRRERKLLDQIWDEDPVKYALERGFWSFATRAMEWNYNPAVESGFGYQYAFDKPANYVRTSALCSDQYFKEPHLEVSDENGYWFCDLQTIYIKYISDANEYGRDYSLWTEQFRTLVATKMALELAFPLTKSNELEGKMVALHDDYLKQARSLDAQNKGTKRPPQGSWVRSRRGNISTGRG